MMEIPEDVRNTLITLSSEIQALVEKYNLVATTVASFYGFSNKPWKFTDNFKYIVDDQPIGSVVKQENNEN